MLLTDLSKDEIRLLICYYVALKEATDNENLKVFIDKRIELLKAL